MSARKRIVVLGAGFAGLYAVRELERRLRGRDEVQLTLVDRENFLLFTPMLHEVASSELDPSCIVSPIRSLLRRTHFVRGELQRIDVERREVLVAHGDGHPHRLEYDHLVLALGSVTNFFGIPGVAEHALTMKSLGDAMSVRNRVIASLEEADLEGSAETRCALLSFVVAGGGFAGVETVAAVRDFLHESLRYYPRVRAADLRLVLVEAGERLLPELDPRLGAFTREKIAARGIEVRLGTRVTGASEGAVELSDGERVAARTLIWTAGTAAHPHVAALPCAGERGRVLVDEMLSVVGEQGLWALGDCALVPDRRHPGKFHPPTAQHATREGQALARNLAAALGRGRARPFDFRTLGQLAAIGRRTGVAQILGLRFSGFVAWAMWRTIYLAKLPRFERKLRVAIDWALDLVFPKDLVMTPIGRREQAMDAPLPSASDSPPTIARGPTRSVRPDPAASR